jgi:alpha-2-macroglobulin
VPLALTSAGILQVTLSNSVVPQFVTPSQRAMTDDALPLAGAATSRLIIASALRNLRGPYRLKLAFDPDAAIASSLQALLSYQRDDGGFGAFADAKESDPFDTAAALEAMQFARTNGASIDSTALGKASGFMTRVLANPGLFAWCAHDVLCKAQVRFDALWALRSSAKTRTDFLSDIVAQSDSFDSATQVRLARYLLAVPGWHSKGAAMATRLEQTLYVTGRYAVANVSARWGWWGSLVQAQAQMLQLLIEQKAPQNWLDGGVRALVAQQCKCGWPTTGDTAAAVMALSAYAATEQLTPSTVTVFVGDRRLGTARFTSTASSQTFSAAASSLPANAPLRVMLSPSRPPATGSNRKPATHYLVLYTYPVAPNAPGELASFRVIRTLSDPSVATTAATTPPLSTMDLATALPVSVAAGKVFDIGVRTIVDHSVDGLLIDDPLPAGFEAVDTSFRTSLQAIVPRSNSWQIDTSQIYRDRVVAYAQHLDPGVYELHYLVRSVIPGSFAWPGAHAYLQDAPEEFGRSAGTTLNVKD